MNADLSLDTDLIESIKYIHVISCSMMVIRLVQ